MPVERSNRSIQLFIKCDIMATFCLHDCTTIEKAFGYQQSNSYTNDVCVQFQMAKYYRPKKKKGKRKEKKKHLKLNICSCAQFLVE